MEYINIKKYKDIKTSELRTFSLNGLSEIYQGKNSDLKNCLISEVEHLLSKYKKNSNLKQNIILFNDAIDCFLVFNHAFFIRYMNAKDEIEKIKASFYIGSSQIHITKLQSRYNQLVYRKQRREYFFAIAISIISLFIGTIISIISN